MTRKPVGFLLVALVAMLFSACAESVGDINRVQPNYYSKDAFEGTWYYRQTVIDVPYEVSYLFNGIASGIEKIRWEVQERSLIAYRVNEAVPGANGPSTTGKPEFTPIAGWAITSHFDIVRDYNPGTGEETNVISENMSDRPWYERDYIRVDWSRNIVPNFSGLDALITRALITGANYWVQAWEEDNPDRFEISDDYIGIVGRYHVEPDYYACWSNRNLWGSGDTSSCAASTIKIRSSFMKVKERPSYEPLEYSDRRPLQATVDLNGDGKVDENDRIVRKLQICVDTAVVGSQLTCTKWADIACNEDIINRLKVDPFYAQFGYRMENCRDASPTFFEKFGYFRTERITYDRDRGHTDAGRINLANRWNLWKSALNENGEPIAYAKREVKPIEFYLNADYPEDLYDAADEVGRQWNEVFKETVAALQGKSIDEVPDVFVVHRNSCSPENLRNFVASNKKAKAIANRIIGGIDNVNFENQERLCSALEFNLGSKTFTWQKNGDLRYSFIYWVDRPQRRGPLGFGPSYADPDTGELINGTAYTYGGGVDAYAAYATDIVELLQGRLGADEIIGGDSIRENVFANMHRAKENRYEATDLPDSFFRELLNRGSHYDLDGPNAVIPNILPDQLDARLGLIKGTALERELGINEAMATAFIPGWRPGDALSEEDLERLSPANLFSYKARDEHNDLIRHLTEDRCILMADFVDDSVIGLALEFPGAEEMTREEIYKKLREKIFIGVTLHEVGHTVGLRHNFMGSADALNYHKDFWKLAQLDENPVAAKSDPSLDAEEISRLDQCIARAEAWGIPTPTTLECLRASELKQASIMDYGAKFNSDFQGLGAYDRAAILFGYGQLVEVFDDSVQLPTQPLDSLLFTEDYRKIPNHVGGLDNIHNRKLVPYEKVNQNYAESLIEAAYNLPQFGSGAGCTKNCDITEPSREVPYMFCTDNFAGWRLYCDRWDEGATQTEIVQSNIDSFRNYYMFTAFKRGRFNWNYSGHLNRMMGRTFPSFSSSFAYYFLYSRYAQYRDMDFVKDLGTASVKGLNLIGEVLQSPQPGWACLSVDDNRYFPAANWGSTCDATTPDSVYVPQGLGRHYWTDYTDDYHYEPSVVPGFLEKVFSIMGLVQSDARYFRLADSDSSTTTINFYRLFKDEMLELLGGIITEDQDAFSGRIVDDGTGKMVYKPKLLVDPTTFGMEEVQDEGVPMLSGTSYDLRFYASLFGLAYLTSSVDQNLDFAKYFKVSLKGSYDDIEYDGIDKTDPDQYIEFTEPTSHHTYYAAATADGHSYGYKLVQRAKEVYERPNTGWLARKAALEAADPDATDEAGKAAYERAKRNFRSVDQELLWRVEFLDTMRRFQRVFEFGG